MYLFNYIPMNDIYKSFGLIEDSMSQAKENGMLVVSPSLLQGNGQDIVPFQYFPEIIDISGKANYVNHSAKGVKPVKEFINQGLDRLPLSFFLVDDVRAVGKERPLPFNDFSLERAMYYFRDLARPTPITNMPPKLIFDWGVFSFQGVVTEFSIKIIKSYPDLTPKIVSINLQLEGEFE